jgi:hypothetical protein
VAEAEAVAFESVVGEVVDSGVSFGWDGSAASSVLFFFSLILFADSLFWRLRLSSFVSTASMEADEFVAVAAVDGATADGGDESVASVMGLLERLAMIKINRVEYLIVTIA